VVDWHLWKWDSHWTVKLEIDINGHLSVRWRSNGWTFVEAELLFEFTVPGTFTWRRAERGDLGHHRHRDRHRLHRRCHSTFQDLRMKSRGGHVCQIRHQTEGW